MIVKATRIQSKSGPRNLVRHLLDKPEENEEIHLVVGSRDEVADIFRDAAKAGDKYAVRHAIFSPDETMSRETAIGAVKAYLQEFGSRDVDADMAHVLGVEHRKARADGGYDRHWHFAIPERLPSTGKVMDSKMYARHERIARTLEIELGHQVRKGRHNKFVVESLREEGRGDIAAALDGAGIASGMLPQTAYTSDRVQTAKREGRDLPSSRQAVKVAWASSDSAASFSAALVENGLVVEQGRKAGTWIVNDSAGKLVGSVDRLVGIPKTEVSARLGLDVPDPPKRRSKVSAEAGVHTNREETEMADTAQEPAQTGQVIPFATQGAQGGQQEQGGNAIQRLTAAIIAWIKRLFGIAGQYEARATRPENPNEILQMVREVKREMTEMRSAIAEHRLAIDALRDHDSRQPEGIMSRINGERREWERDRKGFAADEQAKAGKVEEHEAKLAKCKAKFSPFAAKKAEENAKENASDLGKAAALRHTAGALLAGDPKTVEAAKHGKPVAEVVKVARDWMPPTKAEVAVQVNEAVTDINQAPGLRGFGRR